MDICVDCFEEKEELQVKIKKEINEKVKESKKLSEQTLKFM